MSFSLLNRPLLSQLPSSSGIVYFFLSYSLDRALHLSAGLRGLLSFGVLAGFCVLAKKRLWDPWKHELDVLELAGKLGDENPELPRRIATILQLPDQLTQPEIGSTPLAEKAILASAEALKDYDFEQHIREDRRRRAGMILALLLIVPFSYMLSAPEMSRLWASRWLTASDARWPQDTWLEVVGLSEGEILVPRGESYTLRVKATAESLEPETVTMRLVDGQGRKLSAILTKYGPNDFRYVFDSVQMGLKIRLRGNDDRVGPFEIRPVDRPRVKNLMITARHPADPEPQVFKFSGRDADLSFLPLTKLKLELGSTLAITNAAIGSSTGSPESSTTAIAANTIKGQASSKRVVAITISAPRLRNSP